MLSPHSTAISSQVREVQHMPLPLRAYIHTDKRKSFALPSVVFLCMPGGGVHGPRLSGAIRGAIRSALHATAPAAPERRGFDKDRRRNLEKSGTMCSRVRPCGSGARWARCAVHLCAHTSVSVRCAVTFRAVPAFSSPSGVSPSRTHATHARGRRVRPAHVLAHVCVGEALIPEKKKSHAYSMHHVVVHTVTFRASIGETETEPCVRTTTSYSNRRCGSRCFGGAVYPAVPN